MPPVAAPPWDRRRAGVLLPLAALTGPATGANVAENIRRFLGFLGNAGFGVWQMLPIHPPDALGSPYQSCSAHAGDPALADPPDPQHRNPDAPAVLDAFREKHREWLEDFALFQAIKQANSGRPWWEWPPELRDRRPAALETFRSVNQPAVDAAEQAQYRFFRQWQALRRTAAEHGVLLFGDMPLLAAHDSADVWAHRELFQLDEQGQPRVVAGVPPDAFSATGQRWGNPVYQWPALAADGFRWWVGRLRTQLELFDFMRLDHFRGLEAVWEIPAACATAEHGAWRPSPGRELLHALHEALGRLPLVAEDLGIITPPVTALRRAFRLPGMKVLQFAFDSDATNPYLPHHHERRAVVYTGTHDNDTTLGWFESLDATLRDRVLEYLGQPTEPMPWPLVRTALSSVCDLAVIPMQDLLGLGAGHRTNTPGTKTGNWQWRLNPERLTEDLARRLQQMNRRYGRC